MAPRHWSSTALHQPSYFCGLERPFTNPKSPGRNIFTKDTPMKMTSRKCTEQSFVFSSCALGTQLSGSGQGSFVQHVSPGKQLVSLLLLPGISTRMSQLQYSWKQVPGRGKRRQPDAGSCVLLLFPAHGDSLGILSSRNCCRTTGKDILLTSIYSSSGWRARLPQARAKWSLAIGSKQPLWIQTSPVRCPKDGQTAEKECAAPALIKQPPGPPACLPLGTFRWGVNCFGVHINDWDLGLSEWYALLNTNKRLQNTKVDLILLPAARLWKKKNLHF